MEILKYPHPSLFMKCSEVRVFGEELSILLNSMYETMINNHGIGLAANQVGLHYRMFTMRGPNDEKLFIVNPKILAKSSIPANLKEGCLSAPGDFLILEERSTTIQILYQDQEGTPRTGTFTGIHAVCVQHEIDHLEGKSHLQSKSLSRQIRRKLEKKWGLK